MFKTCTKCNILKPIDEFAESNRYTDGHRSRCKSCEQESSAESRKKNPDPHRQSNRRRERRLNAADPKRATSRTLKYKYTISLDEYDKLLAGQNNSCAICGKTPEENGRRLAVDHDHACCPGERSCGKCIRGLLCSGCNTGLGGFKDNNVTLRVAVQYIIDAKAKRSQS